MSANRPTPPELCPNGAGLPDDVARIAPSFPGFAKSCFTEWLEDQLADLEFRFRDWITRNSARNSAGISRHR